MGVSAGAAGLLYPGAERALGFGATAPREGTLMLTLTGPDPTYAGGEVVAQTDNGVVVQAAGKSRGFVSLRQPSCGRRSKAAPS